MKTHSIPSSDIYTYNKQALDMLKTDHPHYDEIKRHLLSQIQDELSDRYNTIPNRAADPVRKITDFSGTQETA